MMQHNDFANVSWQNHPAGQDSPLEHVNEHEGAGPVIGVVENEGGQLGRTTDGMDLAGVGDAILECTVSSPIKENDGTKDAYVSYLVTTHVRLLEASWRYVLTFARPLFHPFRNPLPQHEGGLQILCFFIRH